MNDITVIKAGEFVGRFKLSSVPRKGDAVEFDGKGESVVTKVKWDLFDGTASQSVTIFVA